MPANAGSFSLCSLHTYMSALTEAYREYLERMIDQTMELVTVNQFTVPWTVDMTSPVVQEWAHFE